MSSTTRRRERRAMSRPAAGATSDQSGSALVTIDDRILEGVATRLAEILADHARDGGTPELLHRVLTLQQDVSALEAQLSEVHGLFASFARTLERLTNKHCKYN